MFRTRIVNSNHSNGKLINEYDAIVIGGGIFGLYASMLLSKNGARVAIIEKQRSIFEGASKANQSRLHRGYHYPRSLETARKVAEYYSRFYKDFKFAILKSFKQYYAISKKGSKTSVGDYIAFCKKLNLPLKEVDPSLFFKEAKVGALFEVEEACFDYLKIKKYFAKKLLHKKNIDIYYNTNPISCQTENGKYELALTNTLVKLKAPLVVNATYNQVNEINDLFDQPKYNIKYELCELAICKVKGIAGKCITVMDGPFFSLMPFANGKSYTLSSVNFTPITTSYIKPQNKKRQQFTLEGSRKNWKRMQSLAKEFLKPQITCKYESSIFEIKPIFLSSEYNDSRPTVITIHSRKPTFISVLAGKISTIYDLDEIFVHNVEAKTKDEKEIFAI